jgi:hypothetical protein
MVFESRLINNIGNDCLMTINGTNFHIQQKGAARKRNLFGSHKYAANSALCYKLGVDILAGNLVWVEGPYPTGAWNGINFLNSVLLHCLESGKHVEVNNSYVGHANKIKCPQNNCNLAENLGMQGAARSCHEMLNKHLMSWSILEKVFRHDITCMGWFFTCVR